MWLFRGGRLSFVASGVMIPTHGAFSPIKDILHSEPSTSVSRLWPRWTSSQRLLGPDFVYCLLHEVASHAVFEMKVIAAARTFDPSVVVVVQRPAMRLCFGEGRESCELLHMPTPLTKLFSSASVSINKRSAAIGAGR